MNEISLHVVEGWLNIYIYNGMITFKTNRRGSPLCGQNFRELSRLVNEIWEKIRDEGSNLANTIVA